MDEVALMTRVDKKYTTSNNCIVDIFNKINQHYDILEINGRRAFSYKTEYFDTTIIFYLKSSKRKLNRYKIRFRDYLETKKVFRN